MAETAEGRILCWTQTKQLFARQQGEKIYVLQSLLSWLVKSSVTNIKGRDACSGARAQARACQACA